MIICLCTTLFRFQSNGRAFSSKYSYGKDNLPSKFDMYTDRTTNYAYDGLNRLSSVTVGTTTPIKMVYTYLIHNELCGVKYNHFNIWFGLPQF